MGFQALRLAPTLALLLLSTAAGVRAQQCCAVGGRARVDVYDQAGKQVKTITEGIRVQVDGHDIKDSTDRSGVYVLYVPRNVPNFVLVFYYGEVKEYTPNIRNTETQKKIPEKGLYDEVALKGAAPPAEVEQRAQHLRQVAAYASAEGKQEMREWAEAGLKSLSNIGAELSAEAGGHAARGDAATAARLYERAIVFQRSADGPRNRALGRTYKGYAEVLGRLGDSQKSKVYAELADEIMPESPITPGVLKPRNASNFVVKLVPLNTPVPDYPAAARLQRLGGEVKVEVEVDSQGNVTNARAMSGNAMFWEEVLKAARRLKFDPTYLRGESGVKGTILYDFDLQASKPAVNVQGPEP